MLNFKCQFNCYFLISFLYVFIFKTLFFICNKNKETKTTSKVYLKKKLIFIKKGINQFVTPW